MCVFVTLMSLSGHTRHLPPITAFNTLGLPLYRLSCRKLPGTTFEFSIVSSSSGDSPALRTRPFPPPVGQAGYFNKVVSTNALNLSATAQERVYLGHTKAHVGICIPLKYSKGFRSTIVSRSPSNKNCAALWPIAVHKRLIEYLHLQVSYLHNAKASLPLVHYNMNTDAEYKHNHCGLCSVSFLTFDRWGDFFV